MAQYLSRTLKDEYFGIVSLLGYNMLRCELSQSKELELLLLVSLITLLDKSDDGGWKRDPISKGVQDDIAVLPSAGGRLQEKKQKMERTNEQKLQLMLDKDVRRSQKQMQADHKKHPSSVGNSPAQTPKKGSPLPTPTVSANSLKQAKRKSALYFNNEHSPPITPSNSSNNGAGTLSALFSSLANLKQQQQQEVGIKHKQVLSPSVIDKLKDTAYDHQHTFPYYSYSQFARMTSEFSNMSIQQSSKGDNPPPLHVKDIQWNPERKQTSSQRASSTKTSLIDNKRDQLVSDEYLAYKQQKKDYSNLKHTAHPYGNRYSTSEYHTEYHGNYYNF